MTTEPTSPESLPYWKTSQKSPDYWVGKAKIEVERAGGEVTGEGFMNAKGTAVYLLVFDLESDSFRIQWPVLQSDEEGAARRQAATMLFHDVKSRCVAARIHGTRNAFLSYLVLPNGKTPAQFDVINHEGMLRLIGAPIAE